MLILLDVIEYFLTGFPIYWFDGLNVLKNLLSLSWDFWTLTYRKIPGNAKRASEEVNSYFQAKKVERGSLRIASSVGKERKVV